MTTSSWPEKDVPPGAGDGRPWAFTLPLPGQVDSQLTPAPRQAPMLPSEAMRPRTERASGNEGETPAWVRPATAGLGALAFVLMGVGLYRSGGEEKFLRETAAGSTLGMIGIKVAPGESGDSEPRQTALEEMGQPPLPLPRVAPVPMEIPLETPPPLPEIELPPLEAPPPPPQIELPPLEATQPVVNLEVAKEPAEEVDDYPLVFTRALSTEETPMLRNWKMLALYSLTVVTLVQPAPAVAGEDQKSLLDRLDKLEKSLVQSFDKVAMDMKALTSEVMKFKTDITTLQSDAADSKLKIRGITGKLESLDQHVGKLHEDLEAIRKRLDEPSQAAPSALDKASLEDLKAQLSAIERAILNLQPAQTQRVALSPGAADPAGAGRVMLVNNYPEELLFIINNREFRVPAMTTQPIDAVPSGSLNYEVISPTWGLRARRSTSLTPNETFTLTAQ